MDQEDVLLFDYLFAREQPKPSVYAAIVLFVIAVIIWMILSFLQKRTGKFLHVCSGRPGIVFPINFLNPRHRLVYVLACGALASVWFQLIHDEKPPNVNKWAANIVTIFYVIFLLTLHMIITFPILACVEAPIPLIGYAIGAFYSDAVFVLKILVASETFKKLSSREVSANYRIVLYSEFMVKFLPQLVCLFGVIIWYHYKLIKEIVRVYKAGSGWKQALTCQPESDAHINYVKQLFDPNSNSTFFRKHIYTRIKIPFSILIVCVVDAIIIFQLVILVIFEFPYWFSQLGDSIGFFLDQYPILKEYIFLDTLPQFLNSLTAISAISPIAAAAILLGHFFHFLYSVQVELNHFRTGRKISLESHKIKWPALTLSSAVRYVGYQTAAVIIAWIIYTVLLFILLLLLMLLIFFPSELGYYYYRFFVLVAWAISFMVSQIVICKLCFIAKESNAMSTLVINNRRAFCFFSYVMLLYNIATGLITAALRVALSFLSMVLMLPRMDHLIYLKGFERLDTGYSMFSKFVVVENLLQNPVAQVFVMLLQSNKRIASEEYGFPMKILTEEIVNGYVSPKFSIRARNRWFVAYTLIKNPKLRKRYTNDIVPAVQLEPTSLSEEVFEKEFHFSSCYIRV